MKLHFLPSKMAIITFKEKIKRKLTNFAKYVQKS
jgi:hypothetical protein